MNKETLIFCKNKKSYPIKVKDIVCIERKNRIIEVRMVDNTGLELSYGSLAGIMREVKSDRLQLCSRSAIVNRDYIYAVDPASHYITLRNDMGTLDLGCFFKDTVLAGLADGENTFMVRIDNIRYVIRVEEVLYAKSSNRVLQIFLRDGRVFCVSQKPIEYILKQVDTDLLIRCVRGVVVNRECIVKIDLKRQKLLLNSGEWLDIGKQYIRVVKTVIL